MTDTRETVRAEADGMTHADWLRACTAWLGDATMRESVEEHMDEAADVLEDLTESKSDLRGLLDRLERTVQRYTQQLMPRQDYLAATIDLLADYRALKQRKGWT